MKNKYKDIADKTLSVISTGSYEVDGKIINVKKEIEECIHHTKTFSPDELNQLKENLNISKTNKAEIKVLNCSSIEAIGVNEKGLKTALLNFASAKNPGGGFMGGAVAQEESLARSSCLYASQIKNLELYSFNKNRTTFLYSDYMIYSPNVVFWMNDEGEFLNTFVKVDVITSPAPNKGAMQQHKRNTELSQLETVFKNRMDLLMSLAVNNNIERIILGAWGCGVFKNSYEDVASYFAELIEDKYKYCFKEIIFAIYGRSNSNSLEAFNDAIKRINLV